MPCLFIFMILDKLFSTKGRLLVLRELATSKEGISVSELSKKTKLSKMTISKIIKKLEKIGIIKTTKRGNMKFSVLNRELNYMDDIKDLFKWEKSVDNEIISIIATELFKKYKNCISIILFGSRARKEERLDSDFDIMIISKKVKRSVKSEFIKGFLVSIFRIPKKEFIKRLKNKDILISNVYIEGKILKGAKEYGKIIRQSQS